jgi:hypothetical protein
MKRGKYDLMGSVVLMHILSLSSHHILSGILLFHFTLHEFRPDGGERKVCNNRNWLHHGEYFMLSLSQAANYVRFCAGCNDSRVNSPNG